MKTYRDLIVWQKSMDLVFLVYNATNQFPKEEVYNLTSQIRRSSVSVPSNIAEGYGRNSSGDYVRFLQIASGSLYELQTQLEISFRMEYLTEEKISDIMGVARRQRDSNFYTSGEEFVDIIKGELEYED